MDPKIVKKLKKFWNYIAHDVTNGGVVSHHIVRERVMDSADIPEFLQLPQGMKSDYLSLAFPVGRYE